MKLKLYFEEYMHTISKSFEFDYAHRVWTQQLNKERSLNSECICKHIHGHRGKFTIHFTRDNLKNGMVTDFKNLEFIKKIIDDYLDHKFIIDLNDPLFKTFIYIGDSSFAGVRPLFRNLVYKVDDIEVKLGQRIFFDYVDKYPIHVKEYYDSFVIVNFVPTSENLCQWFYESISPFFIDCEVSKVEFSETPKTMASYG